MSNRAMPLAALALLGAAAPDERRESDRSRRAARGGTPLHLRGLAAAAAATWIAGVRDGTLSGAIVPSGPVALTGLGVRTAAAGSAATIREEGADLDEVVVTADAKPRPGRDQLSIGADNLSRCSAITYDKPARQVRLTCA